MATVRTAYCSLSDVKRFLSVQEEKVKFSSSKRRLEWNSNNTGTARLTGVTISSSYQGNERFVITFSDSTNYSLVGDETGYLGDGSIGETFVSNDNYFQIAPSNWTGTANAEDEFSWETNSNISDDNGTLFLRDAMYMTNGLFRPLYGDATNIPFYADDTEPIPQEIELANILWTACMIMKTAFIGVEFSEDAPASKFCTSAEKLIEGYIENVSDIKGLPQWRSRAALLGDLGISGVEDGTITGSTDNEGYDRC